MIECLNSTFVLPRPAPPRLAAPHHITNVLGKWLSQLDVAIPYRLSERLLGYIAGYACSRAAVTAIISFLFVAVFVFVQFIIRCSLFIMRCNWQCGLDLLDFQCAAQYCCR